jgi:hypothetical protein
MPRAIATAIKNKIDVILFHPNPDKPEMTNVE